MNPLLIVIDMQNDFISQALGTKEAQAIVPAVKEKILAWKGPVIFTRDTHQDNYLDTAEGKKLPVPHCVQGSIGWELDGQIAECIKPEDKIFDKPSFVPELPLAVDASCCAGVTPESHENALKAMAMCQIDII
ncbi:MAG: cysteine hydrolase family protein [Oliverpabstia sp.]